MKLNDPLYAIVSPTGDVLGDPEHPCVCESEPDPADVARAGVLAGCDARVVRVRIVEEREPASPGVPQTLATALRQLDRLGRPAHWDEFALVGRYNAYRHLAARGYIEVVDRDADGLETWRMSEKGRAALGVAAR